jgi:plasmid stabilization system protein ParE
MERRIEWQQTALNQLSEVYKFLYMAWGEAVATDFLEKINSATKLIAQFPQLGTSSPKFQDLRVFFVTKHNGLYYRVDDAKIIILKLLDTRSDYSRP